TNGLRLVSAFRPCLTPILSQSLGSSRGPRRPDLRLRGAHPCQLRQAGSDGHAGGDSRQDLAGSGGDRDSPHPAISQQHGFIHAGAVSAIADSAAGYAALSLMPDGRGVLTTEYKINLLAPAVGDRIV